MKTRVLLLFFISVFFSARSNADMESTATLPKGVGSPTIQFGVYSGLDDKFTADGRVEGVTDQYHMQLAGPNLAALDPRLQQLIDGLNATSNQQLGNQLSVGSVGIQSAPQITYMAPSLAFGLTDEFTIGMGVPIIHYQNTVNLVAGGVNNAAALQKSVGSLSLAADQALETLANLNLVSTVQDALAARGYKPIHNVDSTSLGDAVVTGIYRYFRNHDWSLALRPFIQLPTGVKADPDDLVSLPTGGQPAVGLYSIHEYKLTPKATLASSLGYQANIQDTATVRVPTSAADILPDISRKDTLNRLTGNSTFIEGGASYKVAHPLEIAAFYDFNFKDPDWYNGDKGWNYSLLSQNTGSSSQQVKAQMTFSTTEWYLKKTFAVPFQVIVAYGQTILGVNTPSSSITQMYVRMFF